MIILADKSINQVMSNFALWCFFYGTDNLHYSLKSFWNIGSINNINTRYIILRSSVKSRQEFQKYPNNPLKFKSQRKMISIKPLKDIT